MPLYGICVLKLLAPETLLFFNFVGSAAESDTVELGLYTLGQHWLIPQYLLLDHTGCKCHVETQGEVDRSCC